MKQGVRAPVDFVCDLDKINSIKMNGYCLC